MLKNTAAARLDSSFVRLASSDTIASIIFRALMSTTPSRPAHSCIPALLSHMRLATLTPMAGRCCSAGSFPLDRLVPPSLVLHSLSAASSR